jgi:hypothetical protein
MTTATTAGTLHKLWGGRVSGVVAVVADSRAFSVPPHPQRHGNRDVEGLPRWGRLVPEDSELASPPVRPVVYPVASP